MKKTQKSGAVLFAKDAQRLAKFYETLAGMSITHAADDIIVLESAGFQLMVHPIPPRIARTIDISEPPKRRANAAVKLVFAVDSIAAARAAAPALGGALNPPQQMFEARGFRACDGHDPEGNVIQFREQAGAAPKAAARKTSRKAGIDPAALRKLALALPDVSGSSTLRGISFKARGKLLACKAIHRSAEPETLVVRVGAATRDRLISAEPQIYYLTPHYLAHESVLVRLGQIDHHGMESLLALAFEFVTTPSGGRKPARRKKAASVFRYL